MRAEMPNNLLEPALHQAHRSWPVLPCRPGGKAAVTRRRPARNSQLSDDRDVLIRGAESGSVRRSQASSSECAADAGGGDPEVAPKSVNVGWRKWAVE